MTILEKAAELGAMIRETEEKKRLDKATEAYDETIVAQQYIKLYTQSEYSEYSE